MGEAWRKEVGGMAVPPRWLPAPSAGEGVVAAGPWTFIDVAPSSADVARLGCARSSFSDLEPVRPFTLSLFPHVFKEPKVTMIRFLSTAVICLCLEFTSCLPARQLPSASHKL